MNKSKNLNVYVNKLVKKPWGEEYLIFQNNVVAIWLLKIKPNHHTSLHCHTEKKTGLILLDGKIEINLGFYDKRILEAPDKIMIRPGLFHSIKAISKSGLHALEFETPFKKNDLVRFQDDYGRQAKHYEGRKFTKNIGSNFIKFKKPKLGKKQKYTRRTRTRFRSRFISCLVSFYY